MAFRLVPEGHIGQLRFISLPLSFLDASIGSEKENFCCLKVKRPNSFSRALFTLVRALGIALSAFSTSAGSTFATGSRASSSSPTAHNRCATAFDTKMLCEKLRSVGRRIEWPAKL
jgi:hypothetical protein